MSPAEVGEIVAELRECAAVEEAGHRARLTRAADLIERLSSPSPALRVAEEALEEARLIVANLPHEESLFLAKIDTALATIRAAQGDAR